MRVTWSMSISRCSSSWIRYSKASLTFIFRFLVRWPKMLGSMSLMLTSISSTPWLEMISKAGKLRLAHFHLDHAFVELAFAQLLAQLLAGAGLEDLGRAPVPAIDQPTAARRRRAYRRTGAGLDGSSNIEQPLFGVQFGLVGDILQLLLAHHVDGDFDQVADHRLDVAADVADLGELRGLDLQERRIGQLGQAAGDFGFAHAGRADHDDVLGDDFFGQFRRQLLPAHAIAQGDGHGALGVMLADHVLVQFAPRFRAASARRARLVLLQRCG